MKKKEFRYLHGLYREITDFLGENLEGTAYDDLGVGPIDITASKEDQEKAFYMISEYLGDNFEDISAPDWEYDESTPQPDLVCGDLALREQPTWHDILVINHSGDQSVEIKVANGGRHAQKLQTLRDLAEGRSLYESVKGNYPNHNQRIRRFPYSEFDEEDIDRENLKYILEQRAP